MTAWKIVGIAFLVGAAEITVRRLVRRYRKRREQP